MPRPEANKCRRQDVDSQRPRAIIVVARKGSGGDEANAWTLCCPGAPFAPVHQRLISSNTRQTRSHWPCQQDSDLAWFRCEGSKEDRLLLGFLVTMACQYTSRQIGRRGLMAIPQEALQYTCPRCQLVKHRTQRRVGNACFLAF